MRRIIFQHFSPFTDASRNCPSGGRDHLIQPNFALGSKSDADIGIQYLIVRLLPLLLWNVKIVTPCQVPYFAVRKEGFGQCCAVGIRSSRNHRKFESGRPPL